MPTALPPASRTSSTKPGLIVPLSVRSTISMASGGVTRSPFTKRASSPLSFIALEIALPPPCTTTGLRPMDSMTTISCIRDFTSFGSSIAEPPNLISTVLSR